MENTNIVAWAKALLSVYRYLEVIAKAIDESVVKRGIASSFRNSVADCANIIMELTERKRRIINLKVMTANALAKLTDSQVRVLSLYYIDTVGYKKIVEMLGVSLRTFFRRKKQATQTFALALQSVGFTRSLIEDYLATERWLNNVYSSQLKRSEQQEEANITEYQLFKGLNKELTETARAL